MTHNDGGRSAATGELDPGPAPPLVIATILRAEGNTGVHTHFQQLCRYLREGPAKTTIVTPFAWSRAATLPVFGFRRLITPCSTAASVVWYRHWHEVFLVRALRKTLLRTGDCVVYAQCPVAARAALRARRGPHQRVVMAVHFRISQADEWADKHQIRPDGAVFRGIRRLEREVIPQVDGLMYVSRWARRALTEWLPEAAAVRSVIIHNFVAAPSPAPEPQPGQGPLGDLVTVGHLELVKNHRYALEVLAEVKRLGRSLTLDVYGEGPLRRDLLEQARALGLAEQVRLRGFQPDVRSFLPRYRAYVHSSYSESSSLAIIEAMAAGLPVVAGDIGPISELCGEGGEARFWPLDDPGRAAETLLGLLDHEPARQAAADAARRRFRRDFDAEVVGPQLVSFLLGIRGPAAERGLFLAAERPVG
jgi:glycosyltransferase involved in cell wall biosynthesis